MIVPSYHLTVLPSYHLTILHELLVSLLHDQVMEVRISATRAVKTICKHGGPLLRASGCHVACLLAAPIITLGCNDSRHLQVKSAAQRTLMSADEC